MKFSLNEPSVARFLFNIRLNPHTVQNHTICNTVYTNFNSLNHRYSGSALSLNPRRFVHSLRQVEVSIKFDGDGEDMYQTDDGPSGEFS